MTICQFYGLIVTEKGDRPQLVHRQPTIERPSGLVRFATRLGLMNGTFCRQNYIQLIQCRVGNKPLMDAVKKAYTFVSRNYRPGDQVMSVAKILL